jgi:hypothetical protein
MMLRPHNQFPVDSEAASALLLRWLARTITAEAFAWLSSEVQRQKSALDERWLGMALGRAGRKVGQADLSLTREELAAAQNLRRGWQPQHWTTDEAARVSLLLATHRGDDRTFAALLDKLCVTAEVNEHVSCLKGFAIFPAGENLHGRAREGARSSIAPIFEAIACHNPYPLDYFDDAAWNHMVVKCVFGGTPIEKIVGLRERRNPELIQMLRDLVSERHAAARVSPDAVHAFIVDDSSTAGASGT